MLVKTRIGHPDGADEKLFAERRIVERNIGVLEFDLRFPDFVQVDVGMLGLGLPVETEESPWQGRVAHGLLGCGSDVERPRLVFESRLMRAVEIRVAE